MASYDNNSNLYRINKDCINVYKTNTDKYKVLTKLGFIEIIGNNKPLEILEEKNENNNKVIKVKLVEDETILKVKISGNSSELAIYQHTDGHRIYINENNQTPIDFQPDHRSEETGKCVQIVALHSSKMKGVSNYTNLKFKIAPVFKFKYVGEYDEVDCGTIETDGPSRPVLTVTNTNTNYTTCKRKLINLVNEINIELDLVYE